MKILSQLSTSFPPLFSFERKLKVQAQLANQRMTRKLSLERFLLALLLLLSTLVAGTFLFADALFKNGMTYALGQYQDELDFEFSSVRTNPFGLEADMAVLVKDKFTGQQIGSVDRAVVDFNIAKTGIVVDLVLKNAKLEVSKDLSIRLDNESKKLLADKRLGNIVAQNLAVSYEKTLATFSNLNINFKTEKGDFEQLSMKSQKRTVLAISKGSFKYDRANGDLNLTVDHIRGRMNQELAELKNSLSSIQFKSLSLEIPAQRSSVRINTGSFDFKSGRSDLRHVRVHHTHSRQKLLSASRISGASYKLATVKNLDLMVQQNLGTFFKMIPTRAIKLENASITFLELPGFAAQDLLHVYGVSGTLTGLRGNFEVSGLLDPQTSFKTSGKLDLSLLNYEVSNVDVMKIDPIFRKQLPKPFRKGVFDFKGQIVKSETATKGFFQPRFIDRSKFHNPKNKEHRRNLFIELGSSFWSWLFDKPVKDYNNKVFPFMVKNGKLDFRQAQEE